MSYNIKIVSEDGEPVYDELVAGYIVLYKRNSLDPAVPDADKEITGIQTDGLNSMEVLGTLHWAIDEQTCIIRAETDHTGEDRE